MNKWLENEECVNVATNFNDQTKSVDEIGGNRMIFIYIHILLFN